MALEAARLTPGRAQAVVGVDTLHDAEERMSEEQDAAWRGTMERDFTGCARDVFVPGLFPADADPNRRHEPGYEAVIMDGVGHFPMLERPARFIRILADVI